MRRIIKVASNPHFPFTIDEARRIHDWATSLQVSMALMVVPMSMMALLSIPIRPFYLPPNVVETCRMFQSL